MLTVAPAPRPVSSLAVSGLQSGERQRPASTLSSGLRGAAASCQVNMELVVSNFCLIRLDRTSLSFMYFFTAELAFCVPISNYYIALRAGSSPSQKHYKQLLHKLFFYFWWLICFTQCSNLPIILAFSSILPRVLKIIPDLICQAGKFNKKEFYSLRPEWEC